MAGWPAAAPAGPHPILADSEVLTIECVGELLGIDPTRACTSTSATTTATGSRPEPHPPHPFVRQAANRWAVKAQLRQQLLGQVGSDPQVLILDSFPMPACRFGRAYRCRRLAELARFGRDETPSRPSRAPSTLRVCWPGVIADGHLAPANRHDLAMAEDLLAGATAGPW